MPSEEKKVGASWLGCYARACSFVGVINSHVERSFLAFFNVYVFCHLDWCTYRDSGAWWHHKSDWIKLKLRLYDVVFNGIQYCVFNVHVRVSKKKLFNFPNYQNKFWNYTGNWETCSMHVGNALNFKKKSLSPNKMSNTVIFSEFHRQRYYLSSF